MASDEIIMNVTPRETRVALIENGNLAELYIERQNEGGITGNIYKGKVIRVLPGMQAAFVDIGLEKAAFLYVSDVYFNFEEEIEYMTAFEEHLLSTWKTDSTIKSSHSLQIEDLVHEGQDVIVQVSREPMGTKGARITTHITLPGRYLVLMPTLNHVGVSRKIESDDERKRLKEILQKIKPEEYGVIARTASEGKSEREFKRDLDFLVKLWDDVQKVKNRVSSPYLIHQDLNIIYRTVRDIFTDDISRLIIDSKEEYDKVIEFTNKFMPKLKYRVELYDDKDPIFDTFDLEVEISRILDKRVWLKSGGYIVIEETEALVAIDVNTGKYVGKGNLEDTILKTNLGAAKEIAYQLRLRNIGGIIIIDFIDMEKESHKAMVYETLKKALKKDKSKTHIQKISELGLVEMTRKRTRESLLKSLCESCSYCEGKGYVKSTSTICSKIFREISKEGKYVNGNRIFLHVHSEIADILLNEEASSIEHLEEKLDKQIIIKINEDFSYLEQFEIKG